MHVCGYRNTPPDFTEHFIGQMSNHQVLQKIQKHTKMRFDVLSALKTSVFVLCIVKPFAFEARHQSFEEKYCLRLRGFRRDRFIIKVKSVWLYSPKYHHRYANIRLFHHSTSHAIPPLCSGFPLCGPSSTLDQLPSTLTRLFPLSLSYIFPLPSTLALTPTPLSSQILVRTLPRGVSFLSSGSGERRALSRTAYETEVLYHVI